MAFGASHCKPSIFHCFLCFKNTHSEHSAEAEWLRSTLSTVNSLSFLSLVSVWSKEVSSGDKTPSCSLRDTNLN